MSIIQDAKIITKSLLAPALGCLMMIAVMLVYYSTYTSSAASSRATQAASTLSGEVLKAVVNLAEGHAALFRTVSWKQSNVEQKLIDAAKKQAVEQVDATIALIRAQRVEGTGVDPELIKDVATQLEAYKDAVKQTVDMVDSDAFLAAMFLTDAHQKFLAVRERAAALADQTDRRLTEIRRQADDNLHAALIEVIGVGMAAVVLSMLAAVFFARTISRPIRDITGVMDRLSRGDIDVMVPGEGRGDEVGEMARAVEVFKENAIERARLEDQKQAELAQRAERQQHIESVTRGFEEIVKGLLGKVAQSVSGLHGSAGHLNQAAEEADTRSGSASQATEQASANVQMVASASNELAASIQEIARQVTRSAEISAAGSQEAEAANRTIGQLSEAAQRIGQIVQLITDIAAQTNLLALNATIEAARAGEAGKGFAVVANEVKGLANQTAKATDDIAAQVTSIRTEIEAAVVAIGGIAGTVSQIKETSAAVASAVEEQGAATREIVQNIELVAQGTRQVSSDISEVARTATVTREMASQVVAAADALQGDSGNLQMEVHRFLDEVKAV